MNKGFVLIKYPERKKITCSWDINSPDCISKLGGYNKMISEGWVDRRFQKYNAPYFTKCQRFLYLRKIVFYYQNYLKYLEEYQPKTEKEQNLLPLLKNECKRWLYETQDKIKALLHN